MTFNYKSGVTLTAMRRLLMIIEAWLGSLKGGTLHENVNRLYRAVDAFDRDHEDRGEPLSAFADSVMTQIALFCMRWFRHANDQMTDELSKQLVQDLQQRLVPLYQAEGVRFFGNFGYRYLPSTRTQAPLRYRVSCK